MKEIMPQIKEMMAVSMQKTQAFAYKDLPNEELQELAENFEKKMLKSTKVLLIRVSPERSTIWERTWEKIWPSYLLKKKKKQKRMNKKKPSKRGLFN